jgi:hypothetical protein
MPRAKRQRSEQQPAQLTQLSDVIIRAFEEIEQSLGGETALGLDPVDHQRKMLSAIQDRFPHVTETDELWLAYDEMRRLRRKIEEDRAWGHVGITG